MLFFLNIIIKYLFGVFILFEFGIWRIKIVLEENVLMFVIMRIIFEWVDIFN